MVYNTGGIFASQKSRLKACLSQKSLFIAPMLPLPRSLSLATVGLARSRGKQRVPKPIWALKCGSKKEKISKIKYDKTV